MTNRQPIPNQPQVGATTSARCGAVANNQALRHITAPLRIGPGIAGGDAALKMNQHSLVEQLRCQGLAALWSDWLQRERPALAPEQTTSVLEHLRRAAVASYLLECRSSQRVSKQLQAANITHAIFKGAAVRERLYDIPSLRPVDDIDVLVAPENRDAAIAALTNGQLRLRASPASISHEALLLDGRVAIDLHWGLFRPGHSRFELAPHLLETARPGRKFSVLSDDANLLVMLVHAAFVKHVNGRLAKLIRVVDLDRMLRTVAPDWDWILPLIDTAGLRTAAWAVLYWTRSLMDTPVDPVVLRHLEPGRRHGRYLTYWIDHQLPARLAGIPGLVQAGFSLALQDRAGDVLHAIAERLRARLESGKVMKHLERIGRTPA